MTDYEKKIMRGASIDLYKALRIISELDINLGMLNDIHHNQVIQGCASALNAIADDLYAKSREEE
jgi:hypothetical protein|nr:MAG: hypothetical protein [Caudoviricetes sp.]